MKLRPEFFEIEDAVINKAVKAGSEYLELTLDGKTFDLNPSWDDLVAAGAEVTVYSEYVIDSENEYHDFIYIYVDFNNKAYIFENSVDALTNLLKV